MKTRLFYSGDINIENGGFFYSIANAKWDYVDAVRVTPCSDVGAADNCFWVETLSVNLPTSKNERDKERMRSVLSTCGIDELPKGAKGLHMLIDACICYGAYDIHESETVQIGAKQSEYGERVNVDTVLRGNNSLRRYAERKARQA